MTHGTKAVHHFNNFLEGRKYFFFDVTTHVIAARIFYSSLNVFLFFFEQNAGTKHFFCFLINNGATIYYRATI